MPPPLHWVADELSRLEADGLLRRRRCVVPLPGGRCEVDGRPLLNFASNDYLDLAGDPRVVEAARAALAAGAGARASALVCGRGNWHVRLEERLAAFEGTEAALLFPTGYAANVGTIGALVGPGDIAFCDRLNHASLVDGCKLSGAKLRVYPHRDLARLEDALKKAAVSDATRSETGQPRISHPSSLIRAPRRLIVTDSVFSMDGDLAPLRELCDLADRYDAMLLVDEAHATGVFGERGRGVAELERVEHRGLVRVGTLSKALGTQGGFVSGERRTIEWLWNRARTQTFSTALAPAMCAAACAALDVIDQEPERRHTLLARSARFRARLVERGIATLADGAGPIVPVLTGDPRRTLSVARRLEEGGVLVAAIRPPTVPRDTSRLRISLTYAHDDEALEGLAVALDDCLRAERSR
jgi:7-keto-8-aminopelargonate synthetase-like enzyme